MGRHTSTNLADGTNFVGGVAPISGSDGILFNAAGTQGTSLVLNTGTQYSNAGGALVFSATAPAYTIGGSGTLTMGSGGFVNNSGLLQTINNAITRNTGNAITIGANNGSFALGGNINLANGTLSTAFGTTTNGTITFGGNLTTASGTGNLTLGGGTGNGTVNLNGSFLDLVHDTATNTFSFGELRAKIHGGTNSSYLGSMLQQRIGISDPNSTDDFSALLRINHLDTEADVARSFLTGEGRRWITVEITRAGVAYAPYVVNVVPGNTSFAVLQFTEGARKVRIVQNLGANSRNYTGSFNVGTTYSSTSLHRSWNDTVAPLTVTNNIATVTDAVPGYGHMIAVSSNQPDDHNNGFRTSAAILP